MTEKMQTTKIIKTTIKATTKATTTTTSLNKQIK
jgi:hypothetical protein